MGMPCGSAVPSCSRPPPTGAREDEWTKERERGESQREEIKRGEDERNRFGEERNELGLQLGEAVAGATPYIYPLPNTPIQRLTGAWGGHQRVQCNPRAGPLSRPCPSCAVNAAQARHWACH